MEAHPEGVTLAELAAGAELACASRLVSAMRNEMPGYRVVNGPWRRVEVVGGLRQRHVCTYVLTARPNNKRQLDLDFE